MRRLAAFLLALTAAVALTACAGTASQPGDGGAITTATASPGAASAVAAGGAAPAFSGAASAGAVPSATAVPSGAGAVPSATAVPSGAGALAEAFEKHRSGVEVEASGTVARILRDDLEGARHQRFIVRLATGQTILVAHNIDLAPRIDELHIGDEVAFRGEYEWTALGGTVHWTHHDPSGVREGGWVRHKGCLYD